MLFWGLAVFFSWILDLFALFRLSDSDKDLELLILRQSSTTGGAGGLK
jgi:hypothetical protein